MSDDDSQEDDPKWNHFVKVLKISEEVKKLMKDSELDDLNYFYTHCCLYEVTEDDDLGKIAKIFKFDKDALISDAVRMRFFSAWKWLVLNIESIDDEVNGEKFFRLSFKKRSFMGAVRKSERKREAQEADEKNKRLKLTEQNQAPASCFTAAGTRTLEGVGSLPPVYYPHLVPPQVKAWFTDLVETDMEASEDVNVDNLASQFILHGSGHRLKVVPETENPMYTRSVQKQHLDEIANILNGPMSTEVVFKDGINNNNGTKRTLLDLGLPNGIASANSFPGGYFHTKPINGLSGSVNFLATSMIECKGTDAAALAGTGEVIANATAAAVAMLARGIPCNDIVVPMMSTTGRMMQFGAVYMLKPSLPVVCFLSNNIDLADDNSDKKAARTILAMAKHAAKVEAYVIAKLAGGTLIADPDIEMRLDSEKYHVKQAKHFFSCCGPDYMESSFLRLLQITSKLADMKSVCLPIAIRLKDKCYSEDVIIFEKLVDYSIGLPKTNTQERLALVNQIELVVTEMHRKGVVHMDLYLSNIMWKQEANDTFSVRIIDFDAVHKLGSKIEVAALAAIMDRNGGVFGKLGSFATEKHDTLYIEMLRSNLDDPKLQVVHADDDSSPGCVKRRLDGQCTTLIRKTIADHE